MLSDDEVGGAKVVRPFDGYPVGKTFTRKEWLTFPQANREAMERLKMVRLLSRAEAGARDKGTPDLEGDDDADDFPIIDDRERVRVVIAADDSGLNFNVIEGVQINDKPLSEVDAELLASQAPGPAESAPPARQSAPPLAPAPSRRDADRKAGRKGKRKPPKTRLTRQQKKDRAGPKAAAASGGGGPSAAP
jgi:hypothetical protein